MVRGMALLLLLQFLGELFSTWLALPVPGNVLGMGLLLAALLIGWVKIEWLEEAADLLLSNMALFLSRRGRCYGLRRSDQP